MSKLMKNEFNLHSGSYDKQKLLGQSSELLPGLGNVRVYGGYPYNNGQHFIPTAPHLFYATLYAKDYTYTQDLLKKSGEPSFTFGNEANFMLAGRNMLCLLAHASQERRGGELDWIFEDGQNVREVYVAVLEWVRKNNIAPNVDALLACNRRENDAAVYVRYPEISKIPGASKVGYYSPTGPIHVQQEVLYLEHQGFGEQGEYEVAISAGELHNLDEIMLLHNISLT